MICLTDEPALHQIIPLAPAAALCPRCGALSPRNEVRRRSFWEPDLEQARIRHFDAGCYLCPLCPAGSRWFRLTPAGYEGDGQYTASTRKTVVEFVTVYKMSVEGATSLARELLHLTRLHPITVLDWMRDAGDHIDVAARQALALEMFSGQIALDEVYDGGWCQLKATDPLSGLELDWHLHEGSPNRQVIIEFLEKLKNAGFQPELVVTDGSGLYPQAVQQVWPEAEHQRCVFHFMQQLNKLLGKAFWSLYKELPQPPARRPGRPKKRGRPRKDAQKRANLERVRKARYLVLMRDGVTADGDSLMSETQRAALEEACRILPALDVLRRFVNAVHDLFSPATATQEQAKSKWRAILDDPEFSAAAFLIPARELVADEDLFVRLTRYLNFENAEKTSNHVERENREFRKRQKSHYRMRSLPSLCALLDLLLTRRPIPSSPRRLRRKEPPKAGVEEEVKHAA